MIYAYLAVIRLDDLGASVFTKFILAQVRACVWWRRWQEEAIVCLRALSPQLTRRAGCAKDERFPGIHLQRTNFKQVAQRRMVPTPHNFTTDFQR